MATKVKELPNIMSLPSCIRGRRKDRIYEDQVTQYMKNHPGEPVYQDEKTVYKNVLLCYQNHNH